MPPRQAGAQDVGVLRTDGDDERGHREEAGQEGGHATTVGGGVRFREAKVSDALISIASCVCSPTSSPPCSPSSTRAPSRLRPGACTSRRPPSASGSRRSSRRSGTSSSCGRRRAGRRRPASRSCGWPGSRPCSRPRRWPSSHHAGGSRIDLPIAVNADSMSTWFGGVHRGVRGVGRDRAAAARRGPGPLGAAAPLGRGARRRDLGSHSGARLLDRAARHDALPACRDAGAARAPPSGPGHRLGGDAGRSLQRQGRPAAADPRAPRSDIAAAHPRGARRRGFRHRGGLPGWAGEPCSPPSSRPCSPAATSCASGRATASTCRSTGSAGGCRRLPSTG